MKIDNGMELKNNKKTEQEITVPVVCLKAKVKKLRERECVCVQPVVFFAHQII